MDSRDPYLAELYLNHALSSNAAPSFRDDLNFQSPTRTTFATEATLRHISRTTSGPKPATVRGKCVGQLPVWMRWRRFWATVAVIVVMIVASIYNFTTSRSALRQELRDSVTSLAEIYAEEIARQIRASTRSLLALEAVVKIDEAGMIQQNFNRLAESLINSILGISALGLAPYARMSKSYPETQYSEALRKDLLLHPTRGPRAAQAIRDRETYIDETNWRSTTNASGFPAGPADPVVVPDMVFRRPIFTSYASEFMPDSWTVHEGQNYTRQCSTAEYPAEVPNCYFPGPPDLSGQLTYFWGFVSVTSSFEDLLRTISLEDLAAGMHRVGGFSAFSYQLSSETTAGDEQARAAWPHSNSTDSLKEDPVMVKITIPELDLRWQLEVAPDAGWEIVDSTLLYMLLLLPLSALMGVCLAIDVIMALRNQALQMEAWESYMRAGRATTIQASISNLDELQFPLCAVLFEDFRQFGQLLKHENVRDRGQLHSIDTAAAAKEFCRQEGVVFISHQWVGYGHPDPDAVHYAAIVEGLDHLQRRGVNANWLWIDYCCIPQENTVQQQSAINSLCAYTSCCTSFLSIAPSCCHTESGEELTAETKQSRLWCRLERLCFCLAETERDAERPGAFLYTSEGLTQDNQFGDDMLEVIEGESTCCQLCHASSKQCDKQRVVGVMLGVYWRLLVLRDGVSELADWATGLLEKIDADTSRYFPDSCKLQDEGGGVLDVELFEGYLPVLRDMYKISEADLPMTVGAPGISDPCAFTQTVTTSYRLSRSSSSVDDSRRVSVGTSRRTTVDSHISHISHISHGLTAS